MALVVRQACPSAAGLRRAQAERAAEGLQTSRFGASSGRRSLGEGGTTSGSVTVIAKRCTKRAASAAAPVGMVGSNHRTQQHDAGRVEEGRTGVREAPPPRGPALRGSLPVSSSGKKAHRGCAVVISGPLEEGWRPPPLSRSQLSSGAPAGRWALALPGGRRWPGRYKHPVPGGHPGCGPSPWTRVSAISKQATTAVGCTVGRRLWTERAPELERATLTAPDGGPKCPGFLSRSFLETVTRFRTLGH